jgi:hypothetical protein
MKSHYPAWDIARPLEGIVEEIAASWIERLAKGV